MLAKTTGENKTNLNKQAKGQFPNARQLINQYTN